MRMKQFSKLLADASWSEIQRELRYKAGWYGKKVIFVDQYYPSSQFCSECGAKSTRPITRKKAEWICPTCGVTHNREINSAKNILKEGLRGTSKRNACGDSRKSSQGEGSNRGSKNS